jgi:serine/threonine-protein kinase
VLFECLSGTRAFEGETVSDTISHILKAEPDWGKLPRSTPPIIRSLLKKCLQKDPKRRLHDIADVRIEIEDAQTGAAFEASPELSARTRWNLLPWILAVVFFVISTVLVGIQFRSPLIEPPVVKHFMVNLPEDVPVAPAGSAPLSVGRPTLALSPDGRTLVYVALNGDQTQLCMRQINQTEAVPIAGTEGAHTPFFSPKGDWVGFFADEKVKKVSLSGGEPEVVCSESWFAFGGAWGPDGTIYFVPAQFSGIWQVSSEGGTPQPLTKVDIQKNESGHHWPCVLPGGSHLLFDVKGGGIAVYSLHTGERIKIRDSGSFPRYVPTGHLVYIEADKLQAVHLNLSRMELVGASTTVLEGFRLDDMSAAQYTFSDEGTLVYISGGLANAGNLTWIKRDGGSEQLPLPRGRYGSFKLSPDGKMLAVPVSEEGGSQVWIYDLERKIPSQLTFGQQDSQPIWTPDNQWIVYRSVANGRSRIFKKRADGSGEAELVSDELPGRIIGPLSISSDGKLISLARLIDESYDPWILSLEGQNELWSYFQSPFFETYPAFSPDGNWVSYTSDEEGRWEIYVRPYPGPGGKIKISTNGGEEARWSLDGRELFYRFGSRWYVVDVDAGTEFIAGTPRLLFKGPFINIGGYSYDVSPDGQRFLVVSRPEQDLATRELQVITNWFEELTRLVPTGK